MSQFDIKKRPSKNQKLGIDIAKWAALSKTSTHLIHHFCLCFTKPYNQGLGPIFFIKTPWKLGHEISILGAISISRNRCLMVIEWVICFINV